MATLLQLGPSDHGRPLSLEEFSAGDYAEGYRYELIDGELTIDGQEPTLSEWAILWLYTRLAAVRPPQVDVLAVLWEVRAAFNVDPEPQGGLFDEGPRRRATRFGTREWPQRRGRRAVVGPGQVAPELVEVKITARPAVLRWQAGHTSSRENFRHGIQTETGKLRRAKSA